MKRCSLGELTSCTVGRTERPPQGTEPAPLSSASTHSSTNVCQLGVAGSRYPSPTEILAATLGGLEPELPTRPTPPFLTHRKCKINIY